MNYVNGFGLFFDECLSKPCGDRILVEQLEGCRIKTYKLFFGNPNKDAIITSNLYKPITLTAGSLIVATIGHSLGGGVAVPVRIDMPRDSSDNLEVAISEVYWYGGGDMGW